MREIEIKANLRDKKKVIEKLLSLGCTFEPPVTQEDVVYVKNVGSLEDFLSNEAFLRIRIKNDGKVLFTIKKRMGNGLDKLEHEVEVSSQEEMKQALLLMGYKEAVRIKKTRVITHHDNCEICIDEVNGLGSFIEMEKLGEDADSSVVQEKMFEFFESLGIIREDRVLQGYDILLLEKKV